MTTTKVFYKDIDKYREIHIANILGVSIPTDKSVHRCPIHVGTGKSPSFNLFADGGYKCYGCGAHGRNAIDLLRDMGYSFVETIKELEPYL